MSPASNDSYKVVNLFDWTGGIRDNRRNPLIYPENSLVSGENADLVNRGLKTRQGCGLIGSLPPSSGWSEAQSGWCEIRVLTQVRFASIEQSYLVAQMLDISGNNRLYACPDETADLSGCGSWTEIYDLTSGAGVASITTLNDRAIITEGLKKPPLVFAGCLDASGKDWAVPRSVLVTRNNGVDWYDITADVCDADTETNANIGNLGSVSGWLAVCLDMSGVTGFRFDMLSGNSRSGELIVEGYSGDWSSGSGWSDGTAGLSRNGIVTHSGGSFSAGYHVENSLPGYWYRFRWPSGTSENTLVQKILFKAPCQNLQVIGEAFADAALGFIYWDESEKSAKDFTLEVNDSSSATYARLNDGLPDNPTGMGSSDAIYIGYPIKFDAVELTPHNDYNNKTAAALSGSYWTGSAWAALSGFSDGTQEPSGKCLGKKGKIVWRPPTDWNLNRPVSAQFPQGYWIRLKVSSNLTPKTYISEAGIWPIPIPLKKHKIALTVRDRLVLCRSHEGPERILISRPGEPHGLTGTHSPSLGLGGQGEIVAAIEAFNQGFLAKTDDWYLLNSSSDGGVSVERTEAAGQAPINNLVVMRAPHTEPDMKNLMGLYYINAAGAWYFSGTKLYHISQDVSWWNPASDMPRLDLDNLFKACGVYLPEKNQLIWSVPMIVTGTAQTLNNRLIVYDLALKTWLPPFTIAVGAITSAHSHNAAAPGKIGQVTLYGGDYQGRIIRLFAPGQSTDLGQDIEAWVETGWLHFGSPEYIKIVRAVSVFGKTPGTPVDIKVFKDGDMESPIVVQCGDLSCPDNRLFRSTQAPVNITGRFFKFRIAFSGPSDIYGLQVGASVVREWGPL